MTGWWFQPLWKILVRLDHHPNYWEKITNVPNHQPDDVWQDCARRCTVIPVTGRICHITHRPHGLFSPPWAGHVQMWNTETRNGELIMRMLLVVYNHVWWWSVLVNSRFSIRPLKKSHRLWLDHSFKEQVAVVNAGFAAGRHQNKTT
jgi:hypothetical protein